MAKIQPVPLGMSKTYTIKSPAGIAAVKERISVVATMCESAKKEGRPGGVIRVYDGVSVMLSAMLDAGSAGISTGALLAAARDRVEDITRAEESEALFIMQGHMNIVRETLEGHK